MRAGQRGQLKFIRAINPQTRSKHQVPTSTLTYRQSNRRFQRGSRIIVIENIFATAKSIRDGPYQSVRKIICVALSH